MLPYEVAEVVSDTELTLRTPFLGSTAAGKNYSIDRNHQSTPMADLSARLARAMGNWEARYDLDMATITGKSAYEVAVSNGFVGTEGAWLESLKVAGEWTTLNDRTKFLAECTNPGHLHNCLFRGKNLGNAFTAAQSAAIQNGTFDDIWLGDFWVINGRVYRIADIDYCRGSGHWRHTHPSNAENPGPHHVLIFPDKTFLPGTTPMNDTNTTEGGYYFSKMKQEILPELLETIKADFGADHILRKLEAYSNAVTNGKVTGNVWTSENTELDIPNEEQIYGHAVHGMDTPIGGVMLNSRQFQLLRVAPKYISTWGDTTSHGHAYWLRSVVNASCFSMVEWMERVQVCGAANDHNFLAVRPYFLVY